MACITVLFLTFCDAHNTHAPAATITTAPEFPTQIGSKGVPGKSSATKKRAEAAKLGIRTLTEEEFLAEVEKRRA